MALKNQLKNDDIRHNRIQAEKKNKLIAQVKVRDELVR